MVRYLKEIFKKSTRLRSARAIDLDVITVDDYTPPIEDLTVTAGDDIDKTELLNRWIVDPGSNTNVINIEAWRDWKNTSDNPERRYIISGSSRILSTA